MFEFFAHRTPNPQAVEQLAHVLRENSYEVRPLLRNLFLSAEFYSERAMAKQIKSPVELMVGTVKIFGLASVDYGHLDGGCIVLTSVAARPTCGSGPN